MGKQWQADSRAMGSEWILRVNEPEEPSDNLHHESPDDSRLGWRFSMTMKLCLQHFRPQGWVHHWGFLLLKSFWMPVTDLVGRDYKWNGLHASLPLEKTQNHTHSKMGTRRGQAPEKDSPCVTSCSFTSRLTLGNYTARMLLIKKKESSVSLGICLVCIVNAQWWFLLLV